MAYGQGDQIQELLEDNRKLRAALKQCLVLLKIERATSRPPGVYSGHHATRYDKAIEDARAALGKTAT